MGLDEYDEEELKDELVRRKNMRVNGYCDYCEHEPTEPFCKFPQRHKDRRIGLSLLELHKRNLDY